MIARHNPAVWARAVGLIALLGGSCREPDGTYEDASSNVDPDPGAADVVDADMSHVPGDASDGGDDGTQADAHTMDAAAWIDSESPPDAQDVDGHEPSQHDAGHADAGGVPPSPVWGADSGSMDFVGAHCGVAPADNTSGRMLIAFHNAARGVNRLVNGRLALGRPPPADGQGSWHLIDPTSASLVFEHIQERSQLWPETAALAGSRFVVGREGHLEYRSSLDGSLLTSISAVLDRGMGIASDGSYVWAVHPTPDPSNTLAARIRAWNESGVMLADAAVKDAYWTTVLARPNVLIRGSGPVIPIAPSGEPYSPAHTDQFDSWFIDAEHFFAAGENASDRNEWRARDLQGDLVSTFTVPFFHSGPEGYGRYYWFWSEPEDSRTNTALQIFDLRHPGRLLREVRGTGPFKSSEPLVWLPSPEPARPLTVDEAMVARWVDLATPTLQVHEYDVSQIRGFGTRLPRKLVDTGSDDARDWALEKDGAVTTRSRIEAGLPNIACGRVLLAGSGRGLFAFAAAGGVALYDARTTPPAFLGSYTGIENPRQIQMTESGDMLAVLGGEPFRTRLLEIPSGRILGEWSGPSVLAKSGDRVVRDDPVATGDAPVAVTDLAGTLLWSCPVPSASYPVAFSNDGKYLALTDGTSSYVCDDTHVRSIAGQLAGWVDNQHVLLNTYQVSPAPNRPFAGARLYDVVSETDTASPLPELHDVVPAGPNQIYVPSGIYDVTTGQKIWSPSPIPAEADSPVRVGALAGSKAAFALDTALYVQSR